MNSLKNSLTAIAFAFAITAAFAFNSTLDVSAEGTSSIDSCVTGSVPDGCSSGTSTTCTFVYVNSQQNTETLTARFPASLTCSGNIMKRTP